MKFLPACRYRLLSLVRARLRTGLVMGFSFIAILVMVFLHYVIESNVREIDRLFNETQVFGEIHPSPELFRPQFGNMGNAITQSLVERLKASDYITDVYVEAGEQRSWLIPFEEVTDEMLAQIMNWETTWLLAPGDFDLFMQKNAVQPSDSYDMRFIGNPWKGEFSLTFAEGFDEGDFTYNYGVIPIIVHEQLLESMGLQAGDTAFIASAGRVRQVQIIASYIGGHGLGIARFSREMILIPLTGLYALRGGNFNYSLVQFNVDPKINREIAAFHQYFNQILLTPGMNAGDIIATINDDILRLVIIPLERNLVLLRLLYPVVLGVITLLAGGFAVLLLLQNVKTAAIMHTLGASKNHTRITLGGEYLVACLLGGVLNFLLIPMLNINFTGFLLPMGLYYVGAILGTALCVVLITQRSPLELLQVRE